MLSILLPNVINPWRCWDGFKEEAASASREIGPSTRILGHLVRQHLQRDEAMQARIFGFCRTAPIPAAADSLDDPVNANSVSDQFSQKEPAFRSGMLEVPAPEVKTL